MLKNETAAPAFPRDAVLDGLRKAYETWMESQNLALESAEEALCRDALTPLQRTWLMRFIQLWDATESRQWDATERCAQCERIIAAGEKRFADPNNEPGETELVHCTECWSGSGEVTA